jgi:hypothetical protein
MLPELRQYEWCCNHMVTVTESLKAEMNARESEAAAENPSLFQAVAGMSESELYPVNEDMSSLKEHCRSHAKFNWHQWRCKLESSIAEVLKVLSTLFLLFFFGSSLCQCRPLSFTDLMFLSSRASLCLASVGGEDLSCCRRRTAAFRHEKERCLIAGSHASSSPDGRQVVVMQDGLCTILEFLRERKNWPAALISFCLFLRGYCEEKGKAAGRSTGGSTRFGRASALRATRESQGRYSLKRVGNKESIPPITFLSSHTPLSLSPDAPRAGGGSKRADGTACDFA